MNKEKQAFSLDVQKQCEVKENSGKCWTEKEVMEKQTGASLSNLGLISVRPSFFTLCIYMYKDI